jgi:hypothetical protein
MTTADFRRIALGMKDAVEGAHMGHPDFRVNGRIFATLRADGRSGMVVLTPDEQEAYVSAHPEAFSPESGAWGRAGCTRVRLEAADEDTVGEAMTVAWLSTASKPPVRTRMKAKTRTKTRTGARPSRKPRAPTRRP